MADGNGGVFKTEVSEQGYFDPYGINNDYEGTLEEARTLLKAAGYKFDDNGMLSSETVSYTHLDVYKRQARGRPAGDRPSLRSALLSPRRRGR